MQYWTTWGSTFRYSSPLQHRPYLSASLDESGPEPGQCRQLSWIMPNFHWKGQTIDENYQVGWTQPCCLQGGSSAKIPVFSYRVDCSQAWYFKPTQYGSFLKFLSAPQNHFLDVSSILILSFRLVISMPQAWSIIRCVLLGQNQNRDQITLLYCNSAYHNIP